MNLKNLIVPVFVTVIMAGILFGISFCLESVAARNKEQDKSTIMTLLLPGNETFTQEIYEGEDTNITAVFKGKSGYVIETVVSGYVDHIKMLVGVDIEGSITGSVVYDMAETWGLGRRAMTDMTFLNQYVGTKGDAQIGANIDAISGATVTSKAITKAINSAAAFVTGADVTSSATEWGS